MSHSYNASQDNKTHILNTLQKIAKRLKTHRPFAGVKCGAALLIKISGEALGGNSLERQVFCADALQNIAAQIAEMRLKFPQLSIALLVGGGNILRGASLKAKLPLSRHHADGCGMLSTAINGIVLEETLHRHHIPAAHFCSFEHPWAHVFSVAQALKAWRENQVLILTGGLNIPYCTTDTASVVRALQLGCTMMLKATGVPGVFDSDPRAHAHAKHYPYISYHDVLKENLAFMDRGAVVTAQEQHLPIGICHLHASRSFCRMLEHLELFHHPQTKESLEQHAATHLSNLGSWVI